MDIMDIAEKVYMHLLINFIKRLQRVPNGGMKILSDNPKYSPLDFTQKELERCYIIGKLVKALPLHMVDL